MKGRGKSGQDTVPVPVGVQAEAGRTCQSQAGHRKPWKSLLRGGPSGTVESDVLPWLGRQMGQIVTLGPD